MSLSGLRAYSDGAAPIRPAAVAGSFYTADPHRLRANVNAYVQAAHIDLPAAKVRAVIAPHAGYIFSGPTAGYCFSALASQELDDSSIYLLGPAHYVPVEGVALGRYRAFQTPLGAMPVAIDVVEKLQEINPTFSVQNGAHRPEHALEVELPFLQAVSASNGRIVPMLLGQVDADVVAAVLYPLIAEDPDSHIVISSDLSHFHSYDRARRLDTSFLAAVVEGNMDAVAQGEACGRTAILVLMKLAARFDWQPYLLDYRNSGDTGGDRQRVVGYGAIAYLED